MTFDMKNLSIRFDRPISLRAGIVSIIVTLVLFLLAITPPHFSKVFLYALLPGLPFTLCVRKHFPLTQVFMVTCALSLVVDSIASIAALLLGLFPKGAEIFLVISSALISWSALKCGRRVFISFSMKDAGALATAAVVLPFVIATYVSNGPRVTRDGIQYWMRGWFQSDSCYLFSLVQETCERRAYPSENPFAAGMKNYYPSVGHCGLSLCTAASGSTAPFALWAVGPLLHMASVIAIYFLMYALSGGSPSTKATLALAGTLGFCLWRPDFFLYPQSQSLFFPILAVLLWWLLHRLWLTDRNLAILTWLAAALLASIHTVSATVVTAFMVGSALAAWRSLTKRSQALLVFHGCAALIVSGLIWYFGKTPYGPEYAFPTHFSFSLLGDHALPYWPLYFLVIAVLVVAGVKNYGAIFFSTLLLLAAGIGYTIQGLFCKDRFSAFFAIYNASRLPYLGLAAGLPLLLGRSRIVTAGALLLSIVLPLFIRPPILMKTPSLIVGSPLVFSSRNLQLYDWIRRHTPARSRFLSDAEHWGLPAFTGRSQVLRGPVMLFGLYSVPEKEAYVLFSQRDQFLASRLSPTDAVSFLRKSRVNYILLEDAHSERGQKFLGYMSTCIKNPAAMVVMYEDQEMCLLKVNHDLLGNEALR